ncbi:thioredoxin domain-containing protein [Pedobacter sp. PAMC26386]|nr:thioredoxin domain-containing protein [Pedobacter sp. PAMC26386]
MNKDNITVVTSQLLNLLKVKVNSVSIRLGLENHPDFPSLLAISDCLTLWGVNNEAYRVAKEHLNQDNLSFPFIAYFNEEGGHFVLIHKITGNEIYFSDENNKNIKLSVENFLTRWNGVILHATATKNSGEEKYLENLIKSTLRRSLMPLSLVMIIAIAYLIFHQYSFTWPYLILCLIKFIGIGVTILLLIQSVNANNPVVQNLCSLGGGNNCNAILKSDAAKINSWLSWSEVGFFYFAGSAICLLLNPAFINLLSWLNILALPYTIYSIGYQFKYRSWCLLCLAVQVLLVAELIVNLNSVVYQPLSLKFNDFPKISIAFMLPLVTWAFLKPFFSDAVQLGPLKRQLNKFKYNRDLFNQALRSQPRYQINDELMPIVLGNRDSKTIITMVSNPFCSPCAKSHQFLEQWLESGDDIRLNVVFTTANNDHDPRTKVVQHLSALSMNNSTLASKALNDWYKNKTKIYDNWAKSYPITLNEELNVVTYNQKEWCEMAEITFTPTFLLNGYKLPTAYQLEDLRYLID